MGAERINAVKTSFFGRGAISLLPDELKKRGFRRALIVTDKFLAEQGVVSRVGGVLASAGTEYALFDRVAPNPTVGIVNACIEAAKASGAQVLVAVGGGSAIDTCKAAGIVLSNGGRVEDYEGVEKSVHPGMPVIAVNTTAGTGSEVTCFYIVTDDVRHSKMCMPEGHTASTGMDALTHAIEAAMTWRATPLTDKDAYWAIGVIREYLPRAVRDGTDEEAREMMAYAQYVAGMAFSNAGLGMVHAMAHALGGFYNLPHGVCNAILLPYVLEYNGQFLQAQGRFKKIGEAFGIREEPGMSMVHEVVRAVRALAGEVGIPGRLRELKIVKESDFPALAKLAVADACMDTNIGKARAGDVIQVYRAAM